MQRLFKTQKPNNTSQRTETKWRIRGWKDKKTLSFNFLRTFIFASCLSLFAVYFLVVTITTAEPPSPFAVERLTGQRAPDFTLNDINGNKVSLSAFKGKVILLHFWATWCPPCRAELPTMNKLQQLLKNKGLVILAISTDRSTYDVKDFLSRHPLNYTVVVDYNLNVSRTLYKVFMVPTTFLIDKKGVVVKRYFGEQDWTDPNIIKEIEAYL